MNTYELLLDLFPLSDCIDADCPVLCETIQRAALGLLDRCETADLGRLQILLRLSRDLGYLDEEVFSYLERSVLSLSAQCGRHPLTG